ncbi:MAG: hypothetical protein Q4D02_01965 [Clostridia bacterium]|nr:hypothetical protein [Clostridia bacterium]
MSKEDMTVFKNIELALLTMLKINPYRILTKEDVMEEYGFTLKEVTKIFNVLRKREKLIYIGKTQKVTQENLLKVLNEGLIIKN